MLLWPKIGPTCYPEYVEDDALTVEMLDRMNQVIEEVVEEVELVGNEVTDRACIILGAGLTRV